MGAAMADPAALPIDTRIQGSLSFPSPPSQWAGSQGQGMPAEPETFDVLAAREQTQAPGFLLRRSKIERPNLPDETLRRDRLLDWLDTKMSRRVIFVVAEAGFGKTTLLADFSRRSHVRTMWYRLDDEDRDGLGFLRYLVAAC